MTRTRYWLARTRTPVTCTLAPLAHWLFSQLALMWHNGLGAARGQRLRKEPCASYPTRFLFSRPTGRLTGPLIILGPLPCIPYLCGSIVYAANEGLTGLQAASRQPFQRVCPTVAAPLPFTSCFCARGAPVCCVATSIPSSRCAPYLRRLRWRPATFLQT